MQIWHVHYPCGAEQTIICLNAVAQIVSEILPKNGFSRFLLWFSLKTYLLRHFLKYRRANGFVRKLTIFRKISRAIFAISTFIHEKMAPKVGTVATKIDFSRFRENGISNREFEKWSPSHSPGDLSRQVSFRSAQPFGLQTGNRQTDRVEDQK